MNQITKFAVKYPVTVLMMTLAVCLLGIISYNKLGTDLFPDLKNPSLYIDLQAGERPPEEIETQFVEGIESLAARQDGVKSVQSSCMAGSALITVEYGWDQDMDAAFLDLQRSLSSVSQNPEVTSFSISRYDANAMPVMTLALTHSEIRDLNELRRIAENYMRSELVRLDGVADIQLNGQENAYIEIKTDAYMLEAYGLTVDAIASRIESLNRNVSGGTIVNEDIQYTVKGVNLIRSVEDIGNIIVAFKQPAAAGTESGSGDTKAPVYLKDIAAVRTANREPDNIARFDGERCLGISIYKENQYNTVKVVENIQGKLAELRKSMPGYEFHVVSDQGEFIGASIGEVKDSAVMGILLAVFVLYLFLRRINTTLIVSVSIPVSIIATFNLMYFNGLSMNIMTLGGLALGAGMLVDNAIVVVENIFRNLENGLSVKESAVKGTSEVAGAITSSTLTTIVVFLPIVYIQGAAGELFKDQAWTVTFSLLSSLFVAILFIPMLASRFMGNSTKESRSVQIRGYGRFVGRLLERRRTVVVGALILVVASYLLLPFIGVEFMPRAESREFTVKLNMPTGTRLENTDYAAVSVEKMLQELGGDEVEWIYTLVGPSHTDTEAGARAGEEHQAAIRVKLTKGARTDADYLIASLLQNAGVPEGVEMTFEKEQSALQSALGTEGAPLVIEVKGDEIEVLDELCTEIKEKIADIPGLYDIATSMERGAPEVDISVDRLKSGIYGVDISSVAQQVSDKLNGKSAGNYEYKGEPIAIEIRVPEISLAELQNIEINQGDKKYRLGEIAELSVTTVPKEIARDNQNRVGRVTALLQKEYPLSRVTPAVNERISRVDFPARYTAKITGEEEKRAESFSGLGIALLLSVLLVYMVMASQFESLRHPFTILLTIPLAFVGTILLFLLTGQTLNMMAFIGIIMLAGIAVNSSIILVDRINQLKEQGVELKEAIMQAGQQRIRPIIMTSLTTILALLPMCFGFGEGASLRSPMALAVIGGLLSATALTLVVIPCVYYMMDRKRK
ncbi:MAG: efflux RND transporter permease subunit [Culturomica sp.]|jgi:HAE1 family hydrophobic/amphiphilic exporter-1|nr:efflux RND transporter permease subunit [Culturomica sp.]